MQRLMREARWNRPHRHCPCLLMHAGAVNNTQQFFGSRILNRAVNLYAVALRTNKMLKYDAANLKITNVADANKYLNREYRKGGRPDSI